MLALGLTLTTATVATLLVAFLRSHRRLPFPAYGWMGMLALAGAEWMMLRGIEPIATFFTPLAWSAYILIVDAAVLALTHRSRLNDAPTIFARQALLSVPLWLIFEAYNLRLQNWTYVGVPRGWTGALFGYVWSFATITPAIFETADLVQALLPPLPARPRKISLTFENGLMLLGAAFLIVPLAVPRKIGAYLFLAVWLGFIFLLDPLNHRLGLPSLLGDLSEGFLRRLYGLLLAGWICGWLWEFWNYWAAAKWQYVFPIFQQWKVFEMPVPGYLGFLPFALECFVMYVSAAWLAGWLKRVK